MEKREINKAQLLDFGFSDEVWIKKSFSDEPSGVNFELAIESKSGWATLKQIGEGFTPYQISKMPDIEPDWKILMSENTIALFPFSTIEEVVNFWSMLTKGFDKILT